MAKIRVQVVGDVGKVVGYYDHVRRRGGDVFTIEAHQFSDRWMIKLDEDEIPPIAVTKPQASAQRRPEGKRPERAADDDVI